MLKIRIHGLAPFNKSKSLVIVFDGDTYPGAGAIRLSEGSPDNAGIYECKISKKYANKEVALSVIPIDLDYVEINERISVHPLGLYHAVRLEKETNLDRKQKQ